MTTNVSVPNNTMSSSFQKAAYQGRIESKNLGTGRRLGKGTSGIIYETMWSNMKCARKDFPGVKSNDFEEEVVALVGLTHPNIVKCFCWTVGRSSCSLIQEYMDDDLYNLLQKRREAQRRKMLAASSSSSLKSREMDIDEIKFTARKEVQEESKLVGTTIPAFLWPEAIEIMLQIATGMEYLHSRGVAHGDLKPKNVLLNSTGGQMIVKVADFGLIKTKRSVKFVSKRTRYFDMVTWKAPELFKELFGTINKNSLDDPLTSDTDSDEEIGSPSTSGQSKLNTMLSADIYSFALISAHILGVKVVYSDLSFTKLCSSILNGWRPELPSICVQPLNILVDLIGSSWDSDPSRRPTFLEICRTLQFLKFYLLHLQEDVQCGAAPSVSPRPIPLPAPLLSTEDLDAALAIPIASVVRPELILRINGNDFDVPPTTAYEPGVHFQAIEMAADLSPRASPSDENALEVLLAVASVNLHSCLPAYEGLSYLGVDENEMEEWEKTMYPSLEVTKGRHYLGVAENLTEWEETVYPPVEEIKDLEIAKYLAEEWEEEMYPPLEETVEIQTPMYIAEFDIQLTKTQNRGHTISRGSTSLEPVIRSRKERSETSTVDSHQLADPKLRG